VIKLQEEERRRIGREIHDSTMQLMVCLDMKIGQFERTCKTAACASVLDEMRELVAKAQQEIRTIAYLIHPPVLGKMTLPEALRALVDGFGHRTGFKVRFELVGDPQTCCPAGEGAIYRVVQEALSNVRRHAKAKHATVRLSGGHAVTHVIVADDGVGLPATIEAGVGLSGMRSRLSELGGRLSIRSYSPGTAVIASIPTQRRVQLGGDLAGARS
jgi:signal transduction histidine kinase